MVSSSLFDQQVNKKIICIPVVNEEQPTVSDNANSLKMPQMYGDVDSLHDDLTFATNLFASNDRSGNPSSDVTSKSVDSNPNQDSNPFASTKRTLGSSQGSAPFYMDVNYTPKDIAEYIFWTGDEKGVAMALKDFLQEGLVINHSLFNKLTQ